MSLSLVSIIHQFSKIIIFYTNNNISPYLPIRIFDGDVGGAVTQVSELLHSLNVSTLPGDHGVAEAEWAGLVDGAFDGERGKNFIGSKDRFLKAAEALGAAAA